MLAAWLLSKEGSGEPARQLPPHPGGPSAAVTSQKLKHHVSVLLRVCCPDFDTLLRGIEQTVIVAAATGGAGWDLHLLRDGGPPGVSPGRAVW